MDKIDGAVKPTAVQIQGDLKISTKLPAQKPTDDGMEPQPNLMDTIALTQAMAGLGSNLSVGETVTVRIGKDTIAEVKKEGESNWDRFTKSASRWGKAAVMEVNEAIQTDPAFAFRETVETVKDTLTQSAPETVKNLAIQGLYPGVRAGILALDIYKAWKTLKDPNANLAEKVINVGHCLTDVLGLVAAAGPLIGVAVPGAAVLAAIAYTSDIVVFGFHSLGYFANKVKKWKAKQQQAGQDNKPESQKPSDSQPKPPVEALKENKETQADKKA